MSIDHHHAMKESAAANVDDLENQNPSSSPGRPSFYSRSWDSAANVNGLQRRSLSE